MQQQSYDWYTGLGMKLIICIYQYPFSYKWYCNLFKMHGIVLINYYRIIWAKPHLLQRQMEANCAINVPRWLTYKEKKILDKTSRKGALFAFWLYFHHSQTWWVTGCCHYMMTMAIWHGYLCKQCVVSCAHRQKCKQRHQYQTPHSSPGPRVPHPYGLLTVGTLSSLTSHLRNLSSLNVYIIHVITMEDQGGYKSDRCIKIKTIYLNRQ